MARASGGRFLLRIEDIDTARCRPEFEQAIYQDLAWLGLAWEEPVRRQSEHLDDYRAALAQLDAQGLVYPAFESRGEIARLVAEREAQAPWPRDPDGAPLYPGHGRELEPGRARAAHRGRRTVCASPRHGGRAGARRRDVAGPKPAAVPQVRPAGVAANPAAWGDVVLARKETPTSYHLSVVVDDARQGVTHVVRGQDLFWSTSVHRLLQTLLGLPAPVYHHHRLVLDADGRKLSKSTRATALRALREDGATPADIRRMVGLA